MRLALSAVAAVSLLAAACGGIENEPNLAKAVERTTDAGSSRIEARTDERSQNDFADLCEGVADYARKRLEISCTYHGEPVMTMRAVDGHVYFSGFGTAGKWWKGEAGDDDQNSLSDLSPERLFSLLRDASSEIVRVGEEDVRGVSTVHYRLTVDRKRADLGTKPGETEVDVWLDEDGLLRRVAAEGDDEAFTMDFFDFGIDVDVQAPPPEQIVTLDELTQEKPCTPGDERPIRVGRALEVLRAHGFDMSSEADCFHGVAGELTNYDDDVDDLHTLIREDGYLTCRVLVTDDAAVTGTFVLGAAGSAGSDAQRTETRTLRNLECMLFFEGAAGEKHLERLDRALDELRRELGP